MNENYITTKDIDELSGLFKQLDNLLKPALPPKDESLWCEAKKEAEEELVEQLRKRSSQVSLRPGQNYPPRKLTKAEQRRTQEQFENRIHAIAEKKYSEKDEAYSEAVDAARKTTEDVLKRIDHLLACIGESLQQLTQAKDTWLVKNFREIRRLYSSIDKRNIKYCCQETIDALQAVKLRLERRQRPNTQMQHEVGSNKENGKATILATTISIFIILIFELLVYKIPIGWLKNHPNSYGLQGALVLLVLCILFGFFKPQWRKWCWGTAVMALLVLILSLLGGRSSR